MHILGRLVIQGELVLLGIQAEPRVRVSSRQRFGITDSSG
jgi:hypothetical protein